MAAVEGNQFADLPAFNHRRSSAVHSTKAMGENEEDVFRCFSEDGIVQICREGIAARGAIGRGRQDVFTFRKIATAGGGIEQFA